MTSRAMLASCTSTALARALSSTTRTAYDMTERNQAYQPHQAMAERHAWWSAMGSVCRPSRLGVCGCWLAFVPAAPSAGLGPGPSGDGGSRSSGVMGPWWPPTCAGASARPPTRNGSCTAAVGVPSDAQCPKP